MPQNTLLSQYGVGAMVLVGSFQYLRHVNT